MSLHVAKAHDPDEALKQALKAAKGVRSFSPFAEDWPLEIIKKIKAAKDLSLKTDAAFAVTILTGEAWNMTPHQTAATLWRDLVISRSSRERMAQASMILTHMSRQPDSHGFKNAAEILAGCHPVKSVLKKSKDRFPNMACSL